MGSTPLSQAAVRSGRYVFVTAGRAAGGGELTVAGDGTRRSHFWFNDRGRGPDLQISISVDGQGLPREVSIRGHDYLKAAVDEQVSAAQGTLRWRSTAESGAAPVGSGFFVPLSFPFDTLAVLARAVEGAPGRRLRLLPAGEAWIEDLRPQQVTLGGQVRTVRQVALSGLGFAPELFWIDEHGDLFAAVSSWSSMVAAGAEPLIPQLLAQDEAWREARAATLAGELAEAAPATGLAFTHVGLYDAEKRQVRADATVVVAGDRIVAVGGPRTKIPRGARVIDGRGKTLLPGFWDMHVHLSDGDGLLHLAMGVTTVRDLGNDVDVLGPGWRASTRAPRWGRACCGRGSLTGRASWRRRRARWPRRWKRRSGTSRGSLTLAISRSSCTARWIRRWCRTSPRPRTRAGCGSLATSPTG
ncbi:MAG: hypothetical protein IPI49_02935 [Myxococcales bacterium]|nr:hypothetical protein [Myxococcales bacterium]